MPKVVAKKEKVAKHAQSVEIIKKVAEQHSADFVQIASGLGYSQEEIENAQRFIQKLEVVKA